MNALKLTTAAYHPYLSELSIRTKMLFLPDVTTSVVDMAREVNSAVA
jgi:hypothetical protein